MTIMRLKQYFAPTTLDISRVRTVDQAIATWIGANDRCAYVLKYPAKDIMVSKIADVTAVFAEEGPTSCIRAHAKNSAGREGIFDSTQRTFLSVEFFSKEKNPRTSIDSIAASLGLQPLKRLIESAFIAHPFDASVWDSDSDW